MCHTHLKLTLLLHKTVRVTFFTASTVRKIIILQDRIDLKIKRNGVKMLNDIFSHILLKVIIGFVICVTSLGYFIALKDDVKLFGNPKNLDIKNASNSSLFGNCTYSILRWHIKHFFVKNVLLNFLEMTHDAGKIINIINLNCSYGKNLVVLFCSKYSFNFCSRQLSIAKGPIK